MKALSTIYLSIISCLVFSQDCITECENKSNVLIDRFSKEMKGVKICGLKDDNQFVMTFVRVEEVKSKKAHYAIQFSHWDNAKPNDHKLATAYIEQHELNNFIDALQFCIEKNEIPKGFGSHSYSFQSHSGLKLYTYYANTGWHNFLIFENYNDLRIKICLEDLQSLKQRLENALPYITQGKFDEI